MVESNKWYVMGEFGGHVISEAVDLPSAITAADTAIEEDEAGTVAIFLKVLVATPYTGLNGARKALYRSPDDDTVADFTEVGKQITHDPAHKAQS